MTEPLRRCVRSLWFALSIPLVMTTPVFGQTPDPVLSGVFPPGGQAETTVDVTVSGSGLDALTTLASSCPDLTFEHAGEGRFRVTLPKGATPGSYDLRAVGRNGSSSPRTFFIGNRAELLETEPNETAAAGQSTPLDVVINGRIEKGGDLDHFRFAAKQGQRVVIECWAERIDSRLRALLEVYDDQGRRLAVNRGYFGVDPLIEFQVPADGVYVVKLFDLVYSGSAEHFYRLDIDTGPRVAFTVPAVVERGKKSRVTLYGWNLRGSPPAPSAEVAAASIVAGSGPGVAVSQAVAAAPSVPREPNVQPTSYEQFDRVEVDVTPPDGPSSHPRGIRLRPAQVVIDGFAYHYPGSHAATLISVTDVPVVIEQPTGRSPDSAQQITAPCEVSGQLIAGAERDLYAIEAKRGEVFWVEAFGERIGAPVDLDVSVLDASGETELARFGDEVTNIGSKRFPSAHLDPAGRWLAPADGRYLLMVHNQIGGLDADPRRVYRLSVRREEPDFHLVVSPRRDGPASINVSRGGRTVVDVLAFRRRGLTGPIRVSAKDLPEGIECPDIWLGPGMARAPLVISAADGAPSFAGALRLEGHAELAGHRSARGGTVVNAGLPNGSGRLTSEVPLGIAGEAPVRISADGHGLRKHHLYGDLKPRHAPGGVVEVAVRVERRDPSHRAEVKLIGVGLPDLVRNPTALIPADKDKGYISFYLPPTLPTGRYTIAIQAQTTAPIPSAAGDGKKEVKGVTIVSNSVTIDVQPPAFFVEVAREAPKTIARGKIVKVNYTAKRTNGFISKIHTELEAPGEVIGLRVRGVTFVGQTESGTLQIIANENAPLGQQPFLRLFAVGVVEDEAVYQGGCFLDMKIVE